jgi:type IV pilus assembly protein PilC
MPRYTFNAVDSAGRERTGTVEAASPELAAAQIKGMGLFPTGLAIEKPAPPGRARPGGGARRAPAVAGAAKTGRPFTLGPVIGPKGLMVFTRQLAVLTQSGLPLLRSLEVLSRQEKNPGFKWVIERLAEDIRSGSTFSEGLHAHANVFNRLFVNMVKAGEAGGVLDVVLSRLARFMEKAERIKSRLRTAMVYPVIVMIVTVVIVGLLMVYVVPKFEEIYRARLRGAQLPALTRTVLFAANMLKNHFLWTALGAGALGFVLWTAKRTEAGARAIDWLAFRLPAVGGLVRRAAIARFSRTLGTLLSSGVPILQALQITRDTAGNSLLAGAIDYVHDRVKEGEGVAGPLEQTEIFPPMVTSMIDVGEETGELFEMLNRIADTYDEEVDNAVAGLTSLLEPIMIVFLAGVVGTIVIALFLPIKDLIERLQ